MAKTRQQKQTQVQQLTDGIKNSKSIVFANFHGLKVSESEELRGICRKQNIGCIATKKTLIKLALSENNFDINTKEFDGGISVFFGNDDEVAPAQVVAQFAKNHVFLRIFGGILDGSFIDAAKVTELSKLPNKKQLLGQLVCTLNAPISGFANVLAGNLRGFVTALNAIKEQKV